jgi:hydrogenase large subunit
MAVHTADDARVGPLEGLDVRVDIENGVVKSAWTSAELFRGVEIILRDRDPQAALRVTPRAFGICGASHLTCAAWALDTAWAAQVPRNAILARNLGQLTESLQSQPRYFYGAYAIGLTHKNYRHSPCYDEAVRRFAPSSGTSYRVGLTVSGQPLQIGALIAGRPHANNMVPGGVLRAPSAPDITRSGSLLEHYRKTWLEPCWLGCTLERYEQLQSYDDFQAWLQESPAHADSDLGFYWRMGLSVGLDTYGAGLGRYLSWGYLPHEDKYRRPTIEGRPAALLMRSGVYDGTADTHRLMSQDLTRGNTPLGHDLQGPLETGAFARQLIAGGTHGESWQYHDPLILDMYKAMNGPSLHLRQIARMHETVMLYRQTERALREFRLHDPWYVEPEARDGKGWGATEAMRGALCHSIDIEDGRIKHYRIIAPTTWNVAPLEAALEGTPVADPTDPVEVAHVARSFDTCLACTVHAHDATTGEELSRFRIG